MKHGTRRPVYRPEPGFSLVELLVVVGIIAVLAGVIFPVMAVSRRRARITACASNLHQIGLALNMYQQEWSDLPPEGESFQDTTHARWLRDPLRAYVSDPAIYHCPESQADVLTDYWWNIDKYPGGHARRVVVTPDTVVAYCRNHARGSAEPQPNPPPPTGVYVVLRANGAVQIIPEGQVTLWGYKDGRWYTPAEVRALGSKLWSPPPNHVEIDLWKAFPGESWPLEFEDETPSGQSGG